MESNISGIESQNSGWFWINLIADRHRPNSKILISDLQKRLNIFRASTSISGTEEFLTLGQNEGRSQYSAALEGPDTDDL